MRAGGGAGAIGAGMGAAGVAGRAVAGGAGRRGGFAVGAAASPRAAVVGGTAEPLGVEALLAVQSATPAPAPEAATGREAALRQHAAGMLDGLATLQRALLGAGPAVEAEGLAALARAAREEAAAAADPALAGLVSSVALRVEIELARRGWGAPGARDRESRP